MGRFGVRLLLAALFLLLFQPAAIAEERKAPAEAASFTPLPTSAFARLPFAEKLDLSPDGRHMAGLFAVRGEQRIAMMPVLGDFNEGVSIAVPDHTEVAWVRWVGNDNIIVRLYAPLPAEIGQSYMSRLIGINRQSGKITKLLWDMRGQNAADILWMPDDGRTEILVAAQASIYKGPDFWPAVYRVDVTTGRKRLEEKGRANIMNWGVDHLGRIRLGIGYHDMTTRATLLYRSGGDGPFQLVDSATLIAEEELGIPFLFLPDSDRGYVGKMIDDGRRAVVEIDIPTGKALRTVYAADDGDVDGVISDLAGTKLLGVRTGNRRQVIRWIDPVVAGHQGRLDAASPQSTAFIESQSADLGKMLVRFHTPDNPGLLFYFDAAADDLVQLATMNSAIGGKRLSRAKLVQYKARDGLEIEGVLTMPRGRGATSLPLIVVPHGGPWTHDELGYDYFIQFLAERGYAVLQPNYRGSTGYGAEFEAAGQGQLGFAMQDDITDGVRWAVAQGIADPGRVCIMGSAFGGYAAMWGIAKDPDVYRCAVSIGGIANLRREVNDMADFRQRLRRGQWQKMTPDFAAVSPINAVARIQTPLLLVHGQKNVTVDHSQSALMHAAMTKAGKTVEFVSVPLADHYFTREADRMTLLASVEDFLARHNPAD